MLLKNVSVVGIHWGAYSSALSRLRHQILIDRTTQSRSHSTSHPCGRRSSSTFVPQGGSYFATHATQLVCIGTRTARGIFRSMAFGEDHGRTSRAREPQNVGQGGCACAARGQRREVKIVTPLDRDLQDLVEYDSIAADLSTTVYHQRLDTWICVLQSCDTWEALLLPQRRSPPISRLDRRLTVPCLQAHHDWH